MGNTVSCFERWGKRQPDGALLVLPTGKSKQGSLLASISSASTVSGASKRSASSSSVKSGGGESREGSTVNGRSSRRRPTYSASKRRSDTEVSSFGEEIEEETESEAEELSAKDVRLKKISEYRRNLTKVVKLKSTLGSMTVKATISKDGVDVEWYKGKSDEKEAQQGKKKPVGSFPVEKIAGVKSKSDNPKTIELSVSKGSGFETYSFLFKSREEREVWQQNLESFRKFIALK